MAIEFTYVNGKSSFFNVDKFESDLKNQLQQNCEDAKIYLFNKFPVTITHNINIDAILVIVIKDLRGNYYRVQKDGDYSYIRNLIIPISFINTYKSDKLELVNNQLQTEDVILDYHVEKNSLKYRLRDYLSDKCGFNKKELHVIPLIYFENQLKAVSKYCLSYPEFTFQALEFYLRKIPDNYFISYKKWTDSKYFQNIHRDINQIANQASKDSEFGYITKRKLERIGRKLSRVSKIQSNLNESHIAVHGKAGTGKSTEMLTLLVKSIKDGNNALFLTYNKLLVFDLATSVNAYSNKYDIDLSDPSIGEYSINTLHAFFYRLSKKLGVLHVMSEQRIKELKSLLHDRLRSISSCLDKKNKYLLSEPDKLIQDFQNHRSLDKGTIELAIDLINYSEWKKILLVHEKDKCIKKFRKRKEKQLINIATSGIFLTDYYGVLEETIHQIQNPEDYFDKNKIKDKYKLLEGVLNLKEKHLDGKQQIVKKSFVETKNRKVGGFRRKRTLFIDEAQDCHYLEKDILVEIFGAKNIVVASGGSEQLIRHVELCNWNYSQGVNLNTSKFKTSNKSYRVKESILTFCEHIAKNYNINLELEPYKEGKEKPDDVGQIIIDFRSDINNSDISSILGNLKERGLIHGCSDLEALLILLETVGFTGEDDNETVINEYGNITGTPNYTRDKWMFLKSEQASSQVFWDGTVKDKGDLAIPTPKENRVIFYESCRGLESWSVLCVDIDKFFNKKFNDPEAEKFLIGNEAEALTEDLFLSNEDRKKMFAATWILMAATRAIDTLYLTVNDKQSELGNVILEYSKKHSDFVKVID